MAVGGGVEESEMTPDSWLQLSLWASMRIGENRFGGCRDKVVGFKHPGRGPAGAWHHVFTLVDYRSRGRLPSKKERKRQQALGRTGRSWKRERFQGPGENC